MLGKGLESLIPPKKNQPQNPQSQVQSDNSSGQGQAKNLGEQHPAHSTSPLPAKTAQILPEEKPDLTLEPIRQAPNQESKPRSEKINFPEETQKNRDEAIFHIEIDKIRSNPHQPRQVFEEEGLKELASSIREFGVLQPILVSKVVTESESGADVQYELIAGERRLMASKLVGLRTIPAIIRRLTPEREKLEIAIIENIQRRNLDPIEEARAFTRLQDEFRLTQREIAAKLGKSREVIANSVRLLNLPSEMQQAISRGQLSESQGRLLLSLEDISEQQNLFNEILKNNLSVREIKSRISRKKDLRTNEISFVRPETMAIKERLEEFLGTKVQLQEDGDRGRITINFYSKEELQAILEKLLKEE